MSKKVALIILDGWGTGDGSKSDAIAQAHTPCMDKLLLNYPHASLLTSGEDVGLPDGQMGNSEVGHLNIGAGRIVYQDLVKVNKAIADGSLVQNETLQEAFSYALKNNKAVHFMGLVSDGGIHSHSKHLQALCLAAQQAGVKTSYIHAFTDGRDCDPHSAKRHIPELENFLQHTPSKLVSVVGRYYALDRDKRWERIKIAYDLLLHGTGEIVDEFLPAMEKKYRAGETDEFFKPMLKAGADGKPIGRIQANDVVICFNFRTDRCREITHVLTQADMPDKGMHTLPLHYVTLTNYDSTFSKVHVIFDKDNLKNTLGEVLSRAGKKQIRIAETEKYPHVTFFFSGGREEPFEGEKRILIHSPKVATYDLQPEMSALQVCDAIVQEIQQQTADFICLNFANPDMVGHTGVFSAIVKAVETTDACLQKVVDAALQNEYACIIIADHGNAEKAINEDGTVNTAHTTNPVPCILAGYPVQQLHSGRLCDIAPTILHIMQVPIPEEMNGQILTL